MIDKIEDFKFIAANEVQKFNYKVKKTALYKITYRAVSSGVLKCRLGLNIEHRTNPYLSNYLLELINESLSSPFNFGTWEQFNEEHKKIFNNKKDFYLLLNQNDNITGVVQGLTACDIQLIITEVC